MNNRLINTKVAGGGGCTDIVDNYDPFGGSGVALYQLNGDATDESGNYDGTASNVTYGTGVFGQAGVFNGSAYITATPQTQQQGFSWSFWVNYTSTSLYSYIASVYTGSDVSGVPNALFVNSQNNGALALALGNNGSYVFNFNHTTTGLNDGQWHQVVVSWDGTTAANAVRFYIDNVVTTATSSISAASLPNYSEFAIGARAVDKILKFTGSIDQVRIFNEALTPLEVEALYTEELCICDGTVDTLDILGDGSCIATYQLDGNANDLSGNYSGTPTNVSYGVGEFDLAGVFNGSSSKVSTSAYGLSGNASYSASLWFNLGDTSGDQVLYGLGNQAVYQASAIYIRNNNEIFHANVGSADFFNGIPTLSTGVWYHFVFTYSSSNTAKIYINGSQIGTSISLSQGGLNLTGNIGRIGCDTYDGNFINGSIDQVRIFNKALSSSEVTTLYNETACTKAACSGTTNTLDILGDGSCIAAYTLDGTPADLSGNYNGIQTDVTYPQGEFDLAGSFNGSSSKIQTAPQLQQQAISISFWVKYTSTEIYKDIWRYDPTVITPPIPNTLFSNTQPDGKIAVAMVISQTYRFNLVHPTTNLNDGQWHHVVFSWDGTTNTNAVKLYIDEVVATSTSTLPASSMAIYDLFRLAGTGTGLIGSIDQVRIFNKALSASEVTTLYNETPCN